MMLLLQDAAYAHPNRDLLFTGIHLAINKSDKVALLGNNGSGKSTLLKILAGKLPLAEGFVKTASVPYYVPQHFGQYDRCSVAEALGIDFKINALKEILEGNVTESNLALLGDDWGIEERCREAFAFWKLAIPDPGQPMGTLSGGQKTRVFLAGIQIHQPEIVLLDEPGNHLDRSGRHILHDYIGTAAETLVLVSHDRELLNLVNIIYELDSKGITTYGGNFDFYKKQKILETEALGQDLKNKEKALRKVQEARREIVARQQKLDARGKKQQEKAGLPRIMMNTLKNNAEKSTSRIKTVHIEKVNAIARDLTELRERRADADRMKMDFTHSKIQKDKMLVDARQLQFGYGPEMLWQEGVDFQIKSGERIAIEGPNGSGKTTLIKLILGELEPTAGTIAVNTDEIIYIDQDYSLIDNQRTVYEQAQNFNLTALAGHEVKIRLNRYLFTKTFWDKPCQALSGGEKMRLALCCLQIRNQAPALIILDEPTNNLDMQNVAILTGALSGYEGALLVVSHDLYFLNDIGIEKSIVVC